MMSRCCKVMISLNMRIILVRKRGQKEKRREEKKGNKRKENKREGESLCPCLRAFMRM